MKSLLASVVLLITAFGVAFAVGRLVAFALVAAGAGARTASIVGCTCWLLLSMVLLCYGQILLPSADWLRKPKRGSRAEGKFQTIELRMAFVFAMIAGAAASIANLPDLTVWLVAGTLAIVGGVIGHDFKRRVERLRQQRQREA
jgi:hypothetical protein